MASLSIIAARLVAASALALGISPDAFAQRPSTPAAPVTPSQPATGVFRRFSPRVVKVQVLEGTSPAKSSLGTGFYVSADGKLVTNYHVVSQMVREPKRYRVEIIDSAGARRTVRLLAVDAIHDLAILRDTAPTSFFTLAPVALDQGERLYALGHPWDLGLSIIEGTYNGLLQHTLYPKIHFSGSLNPGMSGGPAIDGEGRVVGINVATMGNELSFLVPVDRAIALLETASASGFRPPPNFLVDVGRQVQRYQNIYLKGLFVGTVPTVQLDRFTVPTEPAPFFKCWADVDHDRDKPYEIGYHRCSTDDELFLSGESSTGVIELEYRLVTSKDLNRFQFSSLYSSQFRPMDLSLGLDRRELTRFKCETRNVRSGALTMRAAFCVRRYRRFEGLYDAELRTAVITTGSPGLISFLTLRGVSFDNATRVAQRYLTLLGAPKR